MWSELERQTAVARPLELEEMLDVLGEERLATLHQLGLRVARYRGKEGVRGLALQRDEPLERTRVMDEPFVCLRLQHLADLTQRPLELGPDAEVGKEMEALWAEIGIYIKYVRKVRALGGVLEQDSDGMWMLQSIG